MEGEGNGRRQSSVMLSVLERGGGGVGSSSCRGCGSEVSSHGAGGLPCTRVGGRRGGLESH